MLRVLWEIAWHPATKGKRAAALTRVARRQVGKQLFGRKGVVVNIDGTLMRVPAWSTSAGLMLYTGMWEYHAMRFMLGHLKPGDLFVDVGANVGVYSTFAATHGAEVLAFEPLPQALNEIQLNAALNNAAVTAEPWAIGDRNEVAFLAGETDATGRLSETGLQVEMKTLDSVLDRQPALIKIDVEGAELAVLRGAQQTLERGTTLLIEVHDELLGGTYDDVWRALDGYRMLTCDRLSPAAPQAGTFIATSAALSAPRRAAPPTVKFVHRSVHLTTR